ncbi:MAG: lytic transglycosylase domain-containing protein [Burkholderiaceae bacterium]
MTATHLSLPTNPRLRQAMETAARDISRGLYVVTHNGLALLGIGLALAVIVLAARSDLRSSAEQHLLQWLVARQQVAPVQPSVPVDPSAAERALASQPQTLPEKQAQVAYWLSRKYRVAPEPLSVLVAEAFRVGEQVKIDPTLILAVMAIESRFNPFAQSTVGAQGLMQVLTRVHTDKYDDFGGKLAAFDPLANLRVGVQVLQDCIRRAGSVEGGLRLYVGAVTSDGADYINKVMAERTRLQHVATGRPAPRHVVPTWTIPVVTPRAPADATPPDLAEPAPQAAQAPAMPVRTAAVLPS